jgi:tRNA-2-methylthio-N6-dimethylallyladenosine synthase
LHNRIIQRFRLTIASPSARNDEKQQSPHTTLMQKKLFVKSYGCQMNEYDSDKIADVLATSHGFTTTQSPEEADLIILNTCSIRVKAEGKIFSELGRLRTLKEKNPNLILAVGGCVAMHEQKNVFRRAPYVSIVFGPQTLHRLPQMYDRALQKERRIIDTEYAQIEKFDYFPEPKLTGPTAYVSIMEGCNKFCSYCIVPFTRGREISRPMQDVMAEIKTLINKGAKEIYLLGQNVNSYCDPNKKTTLADLIYETAKFDEVKRIRFTTSHPAEFGDDLIATFATEPKLANQLHLPIQSGSNSILKLMRRTYTQEEYREIIAKVRKTRPNISISTDLIVGFPGETEEDFASTMEIVKDLNFDSSFSFIYSPRPNTTAIKLKDYVTLAEKKQRLTILQNQLALQTRSYNQAIVGTTQKVLVSGCSRKDPNQFTGRTDNNRIVNFTAPKNVLGEIVDVKITQVITNSLRGEGVKS